MAEDGNTDPMPSSPFSFQRLLCGDDWHRWDTFPRVDDIPNSSNPTPEVSHDGPTLELDNPLLIPIAREQIVEQWLESLTHEQFEMPFEEEAIEVSFDELTFAQEELSNIIEQNEDVITGLHEEFIDENLSRRRYEEDGSSKKEKCVICLDKLKNDEEASKLECGHDFHFECIKKWLMIMNTCPLCKQKGI